MVSQLKRIFTKQASSLAILILVFYASAPLLKPSVHASESDLVNGRIGYTGVENISDSDIYFINPSGASASNLTKDNRSTFASFSKDGSKMAYIQFDSDLNDIQVAAADSDGSNKVILAQGLAPSISPDGTKVIYLNTSELFDEDTENGAAKWHVINSDGSNDIDLDIEFLLSGHLNGFIEIFMYAQAYTQLVTPHWVDSDLFIYTAAYDGEGPMEETRIYGTSVSNLASRTMLVDDNAAMPALIIDEDGLQVFYIASELDEESSIKTYLRTVDSSNLEDGPVTLADLNEGTGISMPTQLSLSPDGSKLLIASQEPGDLSAAFTPLEGIYLHAYNLDGSNKQAIVEDGKSSINFVAAWSPDSTKIVYSLSVEDDDELPSIDIYTADYDGENLANLTNFEAEGLNYALITSPSAWTTLALAPEANESNDKNGDGTVDSEQQNVRSIISPLTGDQVVLELDVQCEIQSFTIENESDNSTRDAGYDYPHGLANFTADCDELGFTSAVKIYFHDTDDDDFVVRKYNPLSSAYFSLSGTTMTTESIYDNQALVISYEVTDGEELDTDGEQNGVIIDPVGLASLVVNAPNTGIGKQ